MLLVGFKRRYTRRIFQVVNISMEKYSIRRNGGTTWYWRINVSASLGMDVQRMSLSHSRSCSESIVFNIQCTIHTYNIRGLFSWSSQLLSNTSMVCPPSTCSFVCSIYLIDFLMMFNIRGTSATLLGYNGCLRMSPSSCVGIETTSWQELVSL